MKSSLKICLGIMAIVSLLTVFVGCATKPEAATATTYHIEQLTPEIIRVIAPASYDAPITASLLGRGDYLAEAIEQLGEKYIIEDITAINYLLGSGSVTQELLIKVKPR